MSNPTHPACGKREGLLALRPASNRRAEGQDVGRRRVTILCRLNLHTRGRYLQISKTTNRYCLVCKRCGKECE